MSLANPNPMKRHEQQPTACNTLAVANEKRDWRIFADFAHVLSLDVETGIVRNGGFETGDLTFWAASNRFKQPTRQPGN